MTDNGPTIIQHSRDQQQIVIVRKPDEPRVSWAVGTTAEHGMQVYEIVAREDLLPNPYRVSGTRTVAELDSFLDELERRPLASEGTLWGNAQRGRLTAIYNDHRGDTAGWRDDRLELQLAADEDWTAWHALSGKYFRQEEFGDKVEELLHTVTSPDQAELLEVIDSVRASSKGEFESGIERANGGQRLVYKQEHTVKAGRTGQLEVPQIIGLELRPWEGHHETYPVDGYFRVRVSDGDLFLAIKLKPTRQILRKAWFDLAAKVIEQTGKPVYAQP
ncbi:MULTISPECIES: DUF2303 family protein [Mycobacterium]|nr:MULTISPECIES: DUF2303 family protein [Mycobacterium]MCV7232791.1 DUF2303 family protein [Mycobacterium branderi]ORA40924.1 hypothetical protein BST20_01895 [Mycobacterium branderi]BBZ09820.1 hypothetical protein MBRA_00150 [Mycobacterium branderi]BBZ09891.1 hypothetical protein MBRA_00860 [Mycobacterium branderi]